MAGMSWEAFTQARMLDKLGMGSTQFSVENSKKSANAALPYRLKDGQVNVIPYRNLDAIAPAGAINSNLIDMLQWLQMHMRGGQHNGEALIKAETLKEMHTQQMVMPLVPDMPGYGYTEIQRVCYGLGWRIQTYRGRELVWHTGGIDGFITMVSFMPGEDVGVIVYGNQGGTFLPITVTLNIYDRIFGQDVIPWSQRLKAKDDIAEQDVKKELAQRTAKRKPGTNPSHPLADYAGEYRHPAYETLTITRDGDHLSATRNGMEFTLTHYHYDTFEASSPEIDLAPLVSFFNNDAGDVHQFALPIEPLADPIMFTRV
jgi:CubicO group peptidase (beta-lactamase class C family)